MAEEGRTCIAECCFVIEVFCRTVCLRIWEYIKTYRKLLYAVFGGQLLALLLCGTGVTSQALEEFYDVAAPTTQLFFAYFLMALIFGPVLVCRKKFITILKENWWKYIILGVIDVEANFLVVSAYKYTTLTSIQVLDSFTIVIVLVLSFVFLRARYLIVHMVGVAMCMIGIFSLILADLKGSRYNSGSDPLFGDLLCIAGSVLYAISNVSQEYLVKNHSRVEWLALIGVVGTVVSGVQMSLLEREKLASVTWTVRIGGLFFVFVFSLFCFYTLMPVIMKISNAVVINLSLLTADIYTLVFGIFLFKYKFSLLYVMAFVIIIVGVFIFNLKPPPTAQPKLTLSLLRNKLRRNRRGNSENGSEDDQDIEVSRDSRALTPVHRATPSRAQESRGMLVRGPLEPQLTSLSYTTVYSESMSYGSNSTEGSEILKRLNSNGGDEERMKYQKENTIIEENGTIT